MRTQIRIRELKSVFASASGGMLQSHIARLAVLYEDLRIEIAAIAADSLPPLDTTDEKYRRNYFLRRSIATLIEFAQTFRLLDQCSDFQGIKAKFDAVSAKRWQKALRFFKLNESLFVRVRNDIGGHFGLEAARYATTHMPSSSVGKLEVFLEDSKQGARLHFAGELAAVAMSRHLKGKTSEQKFSLLLRKVVVGYRHAIWSVDLVIVFYLWEKFGH